MSTEHKNRILEAFDITLQCVICLLEKELRQLPCCSSSKACLECLDTLDHSKCPLCRRVFTQCITALPVCNSIEDLRKLMMECFGHNTTEDDRPITLSGGDAVTTKHCYYVSEVPTGHILVGRQGGFDILSRRDRVVREVTTSPDNVFSIQHYKCFIYTLCGKHPNVVRNVMKYDIIEFEKVNEWEAPGSAKQLTNLAVSNDKVYVTDPQNAALCVYSLDGKYLKHIAFPEMFCPILINASETDSIIISDPAGKCVSKVNCKDDTMLWNAPVERPQGACFDADGNVWVWSADSKSLYILDSTTGELQKEIKHEKFADVITGMCITTGGAALWATAVSKGLLRFIISKD